MRPDLLSERDAYRAALRQGWRPGAGPEGGWQHGGWQHGGWHGPPPNDWSAPRWITLWLPVILSFFAQTFAALWTIRTGDLLPREIALVLGLAVVGPLALIGARRFPGPVVLVVAVAACLDLFVHADGGPPYIALAFAILSAIVRGARVWAWASVGSCWLASVLIAIVLGRENFSPGRIAAITLGILIVFGVGEGVRNRRDRLAEYRRLLSQREQSEVQAERVRIARELHDVLAHSLSQINVQAGVGLHLMDRQPDKAAEALASIKETSKTALDEVRAVLGALRSEGGEAPLVPEPGLDRLPALIEGIRDVEVALDDRIGTAPKPVQLALFRIVQESLTNVTRHADAKHVDVRLWIEDRAYRVEIADDGSGPTTLASETGGRGLLGMRERAELLGGHLSAGPADGGGFRVSATIPVESPGSR
jgi:signal transduction histidine kinase